MPAARALVVLLLAGLSAGCKRRGVETIAGPNADVTITLVNPTTCSNCDPLADVNQLRLDVVRPGTAEVLASTSATWPGEAPTLPDLDGFGVVRVELTGLNSGRVLSVGRTAPFTIAPGVPTNVPMLFLPANQPIALTAGMSLERSRQIAFTRLDGLVALIGGVDPSGTQRFDSVEVFDPDTHTFALDTTASVIPVGAATVDEVDGDLLMVGGAEANGSRLSNAWSYTVDSEGAQGAMEAQNDLPEPRSGGCVGRVGDQKGVVMGGVDPVSGVTTVDVMIYGTTSWTFQASGVQGFDGRLADECIGVEGGRVLILGENAASTGYFDYPDAGQIAFTPLSSTAGDPFVREATVRTRDGGTVWIVGGVSPNGEAVDSSWVFDPGSSHFSAPEPLGAPRVAPVVQHWLDDGVDAVGCGYTDAEELAGTGSVELIDHTYNTDLLLDLDRQRPGCTMSVLPDGVLLIAGGYGSNDSGQISAVVIVPAR